VNPGQHKNRAEAQVPSAACLKRLVHLVGNTRVLGEALLAKPGLFPQGAQSFGQKPGFRWTFGHPLGFLDWPPDDTNLSVSDTYLSTSSG